MSYPASEITTNQPVVGQAFAFTVPVIDLSTGQPIINGIAVTASNYYVSVDGSQEVAGQNSLVELLSPSNATTGVLLCKLAASEMAGSLVNVRIQATSYAGGLHTAAISNSCIRPVDLTEYDRSKWINQTWKRPEQILVQLAAAGINANFFDGNNFILYDNNGGVLLAGTYNSNEFQSNRSNLT